MNRFVVAALAALAASPVCADLTVEIPFTAQSAGAPFACTDSDAGLGRAGTEVQVLDFRIFVSSANLIAADGTPQVNTTLRGTVPDGEYRGPEFEGGVSFDGNHGESTTAPAPLNLTAMFWNWRGGDKFAKIAFSPVTTADMTVAATTQVEKAGHVGPGSGMLHLGTTLCAASDATPPPTEPCANPNCGAGVLPGFIPGTSMVVIDPAAFGAGADLTQTTPKTSPGCMSFPHDADCTRVLLRLGMAFNALPAEQQRLVTLR
ncbi:MbnP family protein [Yoonia vestfoldensis]|uniref:MbnP family protein n=1 Tax=Yoonia vestfoldensis TaxID=245188 RepID=UPI0003687E46|nr:MbnP family protein [Yoonia vestfoldensis]